MRTGKKTPIEKKDNSIGNSINRNNKELAKGLIPTANMIEATRASNGWVYVQRIKQVNKLLLDA